MPLAEIISDPTRRVQWLASYGLGTNQAPIDGTSTAIYIKSGAVSLNGGPAITWAGGYVIPLNPFYAGRVPSGTLAFSFVPNGTHQLYVDGTTGNITMAVSNPGASFPAGSLPLYVITTDGVNRFQSVQDVRPSTAGMQATMEAVSNTAYRASYGNNFSFSEVTAQGRGAYAVQVGPGTVQTVGATRYPVGTQGGWVNLTPSTGGSSSPVPNTIYRRGAHCRVISTQTETCRLAKSSTRQAFYSSGLPALRNFPAVRSRYLLRILTVWEG